MKKTDAIIIMDGFGLRDQTRGNAVKEAGTPHIDALTAKYPHTQIEASGKAVGLPAGQMGNSEVGHLNMARHCTWWGLRATAACTATSNICMRY